MKTLATLRTEITEIDQQLLALLGKRFQVVKEVGEYKEHHNLPVRDDNREREVLTLLAERGATFDISESCIVAIWSAIFTEAYKHEA